jgi:hypothetical protein
MGERDKRESGLVSRPMQTKCGARREERGKEVIE